ncbi:hypothetical protein T459_09993 [Capsicum annuum]|uniref:DOCKER Lobe A domain-containing protein n=1 Tax=Capsicum annuum TaxID=4072 RepID=A0A2G3A0X8_CAPAN|nr:hypothetical protein T459_09993 [Capsicum annuum]
MKHKDAELIAAIEAMQVASATFSVMNVNKYRYVAAGSFYKLVMAFSPMPDLHIMWLLHLCEARQEIQSWVEAAQCIVTIAGVVMQVASFGGSNINLSAWEDKKNPSESKKYAAKGVTGRKFYNLALNSMMDTPLENSPFLESFV